MIVQKKRLLPLLILLLLVAPPLARAADEVDLGRETNKQIIKTFGLYPDEKLAEYVDGVARKVLAQAGEVEFAYTFQVLNNEMVNAFALPGGYVYVTRGLLAALNDEASLASVLGHEIGHVTGDHAMKQMKRQYQSLFLQLGAMVAAGVSGGTQDIAAWATLTSSLSSQILSGYAQEFEMESDQIGMIRAAEAGYDPHGMSSFLESLRLLERLGGRTYHGFMASHPDTQIRIIDTEMKADILAARYPDTALYKKRYFKEINGLAYGKPKWRGKTKPPYRIKIRVVKEGESFRSIAEADLGDTGKGIEIAALNNRDVYATLKPGELVKSLTPVEKIYLKPKPEKKEGVLLKPPSDKKKEEQK